MDSGTASEARPRTAQGPALPARPGRSAGGAATSEDRQGGRLWPWLLGGLAVLGLGAGVLAATILTGEAPEVAPPPPPLVEATRAERATSVTLRQTGFVRPLVDVDLAPEIAGRIAEVSDRFRRGGVVEAGEVLIRLETRQLRAEVDRAEAAVVQAQAALAEAQVERERQEQLEERDFASEAALQQAIVAVASAEAGLTTARADLVAARTRLEDATIEAPFDALVVEDLADPGDVAQPGVSLGRLVASEAAEVTFGLTPADIDLLGQAEQAIGARVEIRPATTLAPGGDALAVGAVSTVGPTVEAGTRTVPLIVRVERPFASSANGRPLRIDELVALALPVSLEDRAAVTVPARAVKGGEAVWAVQPAAEGEAARLMRVAVAVLQRSGGMAVVEGDLPEGTLVLLSDLPGAADGAKVRLARNRDEGAGGDGQGR